MRQVIKGLPGEYVYHKIEIDKNTIVITCLRIPLIH